MSLFHRHKWAIEGVIYAAPADVPRGASMPVYLVERMIFGLTTTIYRCGCGKIKTIESLGKAQGL